MGLRPRRSPWRLGSNAPPAAASSPLPGRPGRPWWLSPEDCVPPDAPGWRPPAPVASPERKPPPASPGAAPGGGLSAQTPCLRTRGDAGFPARLPRSGHRSSHRELFSLSVPRSYHDFQSVSDRCPSSFLVVIPTSGARRNLVHCSVQSPRTASKCGARFLPGDKGSGWKGRFGIWCVAHLSPAPCLSRLGSK